MSKYAIAHHWEHFFRDPATGKDREYDTRFVADVETQKILYAEIHWKAWKTDAFEPANADEIADLRDSVIDANDAITNADDFDIELTDDLPDWAASLSPTGPY